MTNRNYEAGRRLEWKVRDILRAAGATHVERTAGSHGACDLVVDFPDWVWAVQVKGKRPTPAEIEQVRKASENSSRRWALVSIVGRDKEAIYFRKGKRWFVGLPGFV